MVIIYIFNSLYFQEMYGTESYQQLQNFSAKISELKEKPKIDLITAKVRKF